MIYRMPKGPCKGCEQRREKLVAVATKISQNVKAVLPKPKGRKNG